MRLKITPNTSFDIINPTLTVTYNKHIIIKDKLSEVKTIAKDINYQYRMEFISKRDSIHMFIDAVADIDGFNFPFTNEQLVKELDKFLFNN
jgi:hypothetical protein